MSQVSVPYQFRLLLETYPFCLPSNKKFHPSPMGVLLLFRPPNLYPEESVSLRGTPYLFFLFFSDSPLKSGFEQLYNCRFLLPPPFPRGPEADLSPPFLQTSSVNKSCSRPSLRFLFPPLFLSSRDGTRSDLVFINDSYRSCTEDNRHGPPVFLFE